MLGTETQQYRILRVGVGLAMAVVFGLTLWLAARSWPIVQQTLWPQRLGCGCGEVLSLAAPPITATAVITLLFTTTFFSRGAWFFTRSVIRSRRQIGAWTAAGQRQVYQHSLGQSIIIIARPGRQAMTMGLFRPRIYITDDVLRALSGSELKAVLRHEQTHRQRYDQLWTTVLDSFSAAWFRPPWLQEWVAASLTLRELSADAGATDEYQRTDGLSGAILKLAGSRPIAEVIAFSPNHDRVQKLLDRSWRPKLPRWHGSYAWVLGAIIFAVGAVIRLTPPAAATVPPAMATLCRETRLLCPRRDYVPVTVFFQPSVPPQSVYVFPGRSD